VALLITGGVTALLRKGEDLWIHWRRKEAPA
jgi:hypothetical protein